MVGKPKGRTEKALRQKAVSLCANPATRSQGLMLQEYHGKIRRAQAWRDGAIIASLSDEVLEQDLKMFDSEGCVLPAVECQAFEEGEPSGNRAVVEDLLRCSVPLARCRHEGRVRCESASDVSIATSDVVEVGGDADDGDRRVAGTVVVRGLRLPADPHSTLEGRARGFGLV